MQYVYIHSQSFGFVLKLIRSYINRGVRGYYCNFVTFLDKGEGVRHYATLSSISHLGFNVFFRFIAFYNHHHPPFSIVALFVAYEYYDQWIVVHHLLDAKRARLYGEEVMKPTTLTHFVIAAAAFLIVFITAETLETARLP